MFALVSSVAQKHHLREDYLRAQMMIESSGDPNAFRFEKGFYVRYVASAVNKPPWAKYGPLAACSYGLLQIMLVVAMENGFTGQPWDLFVPEVGLDWGALHFAELLRWSKGDYYQALAAYNGGKGGNEKPPYRNQVYADKVVRQLTKHIGSAKP